MSKYSQFVDEPVKVTISGIDMSFRQLPLEAESIRYNKELSEEERGTRLLFAFIKHSLDGITDDEALGLLRKHPVEILDAYKKVHGINTDD